MKDTELKRLRDAALYREYIRGLEAGRFASLWEAADYIVRQPAPQYFISAREACRQIGVIRSGRDTRPLHSSSRRRAEHLLALYRQYVRDHPGCALSRERVLETLVESPAPEYYIGREAARAVLRREIRKRRKKWAEQ